MTFIAITEQGLFPKSECVHDHLWHPSVHEAIHRDTVIGRLWLLVVAVK